MSSERDKLCGNPDVFMGQDGEVEAGGGGVVLALSGPQTGICC